MTNQPIKLTDDALRSLLHGLGMHYPLGEAKQIVDAIRTLRDRAKAVIHEADNQGEYDRVRYCKVIDDRIIDALREVLP